MLETQQIIATLGIEQLPALEQKEIVDKVMLRLNDVVVETLVKSLTPEQQQEFEEVLLNMPEDLEEKVTQIAATMPFLIADVQEAIAGELIVLKAVLNP